MIVVVLLLLLLLLFPLLLSRGDCCGIASARRAVGVAATSSVLIFEDEDAVGVDGEFLDCSASLVFGANDTRRLTPLPPPVGELITEEGARSSSSCCCL